jgi:hypothetical protein
MPSASLDELLNNLSKVNSPENIAQLEKYLQAHSEESSRPGVLVRFLVNTLDPLPGSVEDVLYGILCDQSNPLRQMVSSTLTTQGTSIATTALVTGLGSIISGPVAGIIAGLVVKLISDSADQDFSEEINRARAELRLAQAEKEQPQRPAMKARKTSRRTTSPQKELVTSATTKRTPARTKPALRKTNAQSGDEENQKHGENKSPSAPPKHSQRPAKPSKPGAAAGTLPARKPPARKKPATPRSIGSRPKTAKNKTNNSE